MMGDGPASSSFDRIAENHARSFIRVARQFADPAPDVFRVISEMDELTRLDPEWPLLAFTPFAVLPRVETSTAPPLPGEDTIERGTPASGWWFEPSLGSNQSGDVTRTQPSAGSMATPADGSLSGPTASAREQPPVFSLRRTLQEASSQTSSRPSRRASSARYRDDRVQESVAPPDTFVPADVPIEPDGARPSRRTAWQAGDALGDRAPMRSAGFGVRAGTDLLPGTGTASPGSEQSFRTLHAGLQSVARETLGLVDRLADAVLAQGCSPSPVTPETRPNQVHRSLPNVAVPVFALEASDANSASLEPSPVSASAVPHDPTTRSSSATPQRLESLSALGEPASPLELAATTREQPSASEVAPPPWLDPDEITEVVTRALYEQARRHGVDLS